MYQEEVKSAIILLYLGILAGMDVRKRQISLVLTGVLFLAGIGWQILVEQTSWLEWLLSLLPGAGFLTLSYISREQVGYGDGLLLLTVGIWLGFGQTFGPNRRLMRTWGVLPMVCRMFSTLMASPGEGDEKV